MEREEIRVVLMHSGNKAEYSMELVQPLTLSKNWMVAVTELSISSLPLNFGPGNENFTCECYDQNGIKKSETFHIGDRIIDSGENLITAIKSMGEKSEIFSQTVTALNWISRSKKAEFKLSDNSRILFSPRLAAVLSLDEVIESSAESKYCVDPRLHFWQFFIYCSISVPVIVGEDLLPVVQTILLEEFNKSQNTFKIFNPPTFLPLAKYFLPRIDLKLCDELGNVLKFPRGCTIICKLLFKNPGE